MTHTQINMGEVRYNAASQCFEALVSVGSGDSRKTFPCAIQAPLNMSFAQAADGLKTQAIRRSAQGIDMYSHTRTHTPPLRAGRARFDPRRWLVQLGFGALEKAA